MFDHEKLDVYKRSIQFLALSAKIVAAIPRGQNHIADQMKRAALSIPLNVAEGTGKLTAADRRRFYGIARGSAMECGAILDVLRALGLCSDEDLDTAKSLLIRVVAMLTKLCKSQR
jgi:four helix bundle protein